VAPGDRGVRRGTWHVAYGFGEAAKPQNFQRRPHEGVVEQVVTTNDSLPVTGARQAASSEQQ
jgi:hypothetical protein